MELSLKAPSLSRLQAEASVAKERAEVLGEELARVRKQFEDACSDRDTAIRKLYEKLSEEGLVLGA